MVHRFIKKTKPQLQENKNSNELGRKNSFEPSRIEESSESKQNNFLPRSFGNMMNYIAYRNKKDRLMKIVNNVIFVFA